MLYAAAFAWCLGAVGAPPVPAGGKARPPWPPLNTAARHDDLATAKRLLAAGAKVDTRDADGWTPLHAAALKRNRAMVELLLKYKADPNIRDEFGSTPLHNAAQF